MNSMVLLLALTVPTVNYGWRPGADGQLEYIVQLEAESLEALRSGKEISSDIHPEARGVRRFVLRFGDQEVPRVLPPDNRQAHVARAGKPAQHAVYMMGTGTAEQGWQPGADGRLEYLIQLDEVALEALEAGEEITSELHPEVQDVQRFVVRFGSTDLPRVAVAAASGAGGTAQPRNASTTLQVEPQYRGGPGANGGVRSSQAGTAAANPADYRYNDPYAKDPAGATSPPNGYAPATQGSNPAANRYTTEPANRYAAEPANRYAAEPANRYADDPARSSPRNDYSAQGPSSPSLLQPPSSSAAPWNNTDSDPDDETTIARADRWQSTAAPSQPDIERDAPGDRWAQAPTGQNYPATDWRQPPYQPSRDVPASGPEIENPRTASGRPAAQSPVFSRPASRPVVEEYRDDYEEPPIRVAQDPVRSRATSAPRTARANPPAAYEGEDSPSSRAAASEHDPDKERSSLLKELVLFASLGINVVAVLIARQYYLRYRMLIREMRDPETMVA